MVGEWGWGRAPINSGMGLFAWHFSPLPEGAPRPTQLLLWAQREEKGMRLKSFQLSNIKSQDQTPLSTLLCHCNDGSTGMRWQPSFLPLKLWLLCFLTFLPHYFPASLGGFSTSSAPALSFPAFLPGTCPTSANASPLVLKVWTSLWRQ